MSYEKAYQMWESSKTQPLYYDHLRKIIAVINRQKLDEKGDCYSKSGGSAELILIHDETGMVISAVPKFQTPTSECFVELFLGKQFPAPPFSPYYEHMLFK